MRLNRDRITTTIEREWLAQIIAGTKKIEYRQIKPYWTKRFAKVSLPFELRLLNGMSPPVPEATVVRVPDLSDQIACRLQPKRLTCEDNVEGNEHHPRQHDLPAPALRCGWQGNDREHLRVVWVSHVRPQR